MRLWAAIGFALPVASAGCGFDWSRYADHQSGDDVTCATGVKDSRVARLSRGVDLYGWLSEDAAPSEFIQDSELQELARIGVTFVRASFYTPLLFDTERPDQLNPIQLDKFNQLAQSARSANLGILFAPYFDPEFKLQLGAEETRELALETLIDMWKAFGQYLSTTDPDWVFPELMGAPDFADNDVWTSILHRLAADVRQVVPQHTIVADGNSGSFRVNWTSMTALSSLGPVPRERNIIYGFIFFDPVIFTHQGADWRPEWPELASVSNLPYPSSPNLVEPALLGISDPAARADAESYGRESFGPELLGLGLDKVAAWSENHCARVMCVEFGAYRDAAPADSVSRWVKDVRTLFDQHRIGWSYWSYRERMGIAAPQPGPVIDLQIGTALGLRP